MLHPPLTPSFLYYPPPEDDLVSAPQKLVKAKSSKAQTASGSEDDDELMLSQSEPENPSDGAVSDGDDGLNGDDDAVHRRLLAEVCQSNCKSYVHIR
jgi:hypothetical protein